MKKKKILVVDDEEILTRTYTILLEKSGFDVYSAKSSSDALVILEEEKVDLVICDIRMPGMDGVEVIKTMRQDSHYAQNQSVAAIFVTGFADPQKEEDAKALAPIAYLHKPFDNTRLLEIIQRSIGK